jgi:hypothetical protein
MNKKKYCQGCRDDFYNGKNDRGVKECNSLKNAKVVEKGVFFSIHQIKPRKIKTLDCFTPRR